MEEPKESMAKATIPHHHYSNLLASIDMGTNSFKLHIIHFQPTTSILTPFLHISSPSLLTQPPSSPSSLISVESQIRAIEVLRNFHTLIQSHHISQTRIVATSATREAVNQSEFVEKLEKNMGFDYDVNVLSGLEEARLTYLGVLQFCPVNDSRVLSVDIGGGSTEFVIGDDKGEIFYAESLKLGHLTLAQKFGDDNLMKMREYIRGQIEKASGLVQKVTNFGFQIVIGSSGTIRAIEKAILFGYGKNHDNVGSFGSFKRKFWWFRREELRGLIERLCNECEIERVRRDGFFGRRSESIVAGAVLLEEIFDVFGISEMQVSGYALGHGVVVDMISKAFPGFNFKANVRWKSVMRLAMRFNEKNKMNSCAKCAAFAKEMFEGLRKYKKVNENQHTVGFYLHDKDLEYLEAACMLHKIGSYAGKKGYHRRSYSTIMECGQLDGYTSEEVELIALLVKHHRKKFPLVDHTSLQGFSGEKFEILCFILRISVIVQKYNSTLSGIKFYHCHEGLIMALIYEPNSEQPMTKDLEKKVRKELRHFEGVFHQKLLSVIHTVNSYLQDRSSGNFMLDTLSEPQFFNE